MCFSSASARGWSSTTEAGEIERHNGSILVDPRLPREYFRWYKKKEIDGNGSLTALFTAYQLVNFLSVALKMYQSEIEQTQYQKNERFFPIPPRVGVRSGGILETLFPVARRRPEGKDGE